ncbi:hypothetical protein IX51_00575 [uncultured archaeon]|nr:hypothetical protein IX51_00575 [uncultured archaeon]HKJ96471.1 hypothetical protein [Thermoplasmataceae archaeon]
MSTDERLVEAIKKSRKVSQDESLVTYDLTEGVDLSNPRNVAEALATVFFEEDAEKWFTASGDHVDFNPTYKVRVVLAEDHGKRIEETVDDFLEDLQKEEIYPAFSQQIKDTADNASKLKAGIVASTVNNLFFRHSNRKMYSDYIRDDLFLDILEKLEIRSLNDKDLMDWKNLPL